MSVRAKTALFDTLETFVATLPSGDALFGAVGLRNTRGKVEVSKVFRVECTSGAMTMSDDECCKEMNVDFTLQFFALPTDESFEALDDAFDLSFQMARSAYDELNGKDLDGAVCSVDFPEAEGNYRVGVANLGATQYAATYLMGVVNP